MCSTNAGNGCNYVVVKSFISALQRKPIYQSTADSALSIFKERQFLNAQRQCPQFSAFRTHQRDCSLVASHHYLANHVRWKTF